jgi:hypothetical protein
MGAMPFSRVGRLVGQSNTITPDLAALADSNRLTLANRGASRFVDGAKTGIRLTAAPGDGAAFVPDIQFTTGTIELDLRGKDVPQQSFVGVAFHGVSASAFDCVYFRPFNFKAPDPTSRGHAVQYHSSPDYTWDKLRASQPGKYEQPIAPVPDPNDWFHARIVVSDSMVVVFVEKASMWCLAVDPIGNHQRGLVGLWVGNGSGGEFANLTITAT